MSKRKREEKKEKENIQNETKNESGVIVVEEEKRRKEGMLIYKGKPYEQFLCKCGLIRFDGNGLYSTKNPEVILIMKKYKYHEVNS